MADTGAGLVCTQLTKSFGPASTCSRASTSPLPHGKVIGLIGENGAGKSTLSSLITGVHRPDSGIDDPRRPALLAARRPPTRSHAGVVLIHQEIRLLPELTVAENIFLGRLPRKGGRIDRRGMYDESREVLDLLGAHVDPDRPVGGLSMAVQQEIEIAKAITRKPRYIIFDEPSASLGGSETERVLDRIRGAARPGRRRRLHLPPPRRGARGGRRHRLPARRPAGRRLGHRQRADRRTWSTRWSAASSPTSTSRPSPATTGPCWRCAGWAGTGSSRTSTSASTPARCSGSPGSSAPAAPRPCAPSRAPTAPTPARCSSTASRSTPATRAAAIKAGIVMVPEDRKGQGLNLDRTAAENVTLPWEPVLAKAGLVTAAIVRAAGAKLSGELDIRGRMGLPGRVDVRRQPAEGAAGQVAGPRSRRC